MASVCVTCLQDAGFEFAFDPIKVKFKPSAKDMQVAEESGTDLAQLVRKKLKQKEKQASLQPTKTGLPPSAPTHYRFGTCALLLRCQCFC